MQIEMSIEPVDPFERLEEFRRRSNAILDHLLLDVQESSIDDRSIAFQPEVDLVETEHEFRFYLSIPGMVEDDFLIEVDGHHVTIRGERKPPYDPEHRKVSITEWRYGFFQRQFKLPVLIVVASIRATYDSGVLTIVAEKVTTKSSTTGFENLRDVGSDVEDGSGP